MLNPSFLWWLSCEAYKRNFIFIARLLKGVNFVVFHAVLPYQAEIQRDINLKHYGLGIVIHPNVRIGHRVTIHQHVTLAAETWIGAPYKLIIGDDVMIGAGAAIIGRGNQDLVIGNNVKVGANAVVTRDVASGQTVVGVPARPLSSPMISSNVQDVNQDVETYIPTKI